MNVITSDERFADKHYADWLLQDQSTHAGRWVPASAVGCVAQAMTLLSGTEARFRVCAGATEHGGHYVHSEVIEHAVMLQHSAVYESLADAERSRKRFERHHYDSWSERGGVSGVKYWSIPFLEAVPRSEPAG